VTARVARVALDLPVDEAFDFRVPDDTEVPLGALVVVPFGRTRKVGVVVALAQSSAVPAARLRDIESVISDVAAYKPDELELFEFCAAYYQRALGEVIASSMPPRLRQVSRRALRPTPPTPGPLGFDASLPLLPEQRSAIDAVLAGASGFHPVLLHGVTGSGKTEVYLHLIADTLSRGRQALMLVPEIGLTPQFEERVRERFPGAHLATAHSGLALGERAQAWLDAQAGSARIVLGTRSAVFMPFRDLGLVVVDEEHDGSYKQQESLRYSARDVAVRRAQRLGIPVILGSATPSLETMANAAEGRYALVRLRSRAVAGAAPPVVRTIDTRADRPVEGLAHGLVSAIRERIARGEQSLVFVNRRGYAPVLFCAACSWHSTCARCSANLVLHRNDGELRCHHCGRRERVPVACPGCGAGGLAPVGQGTQRVEEALAATLGEARIARIDRDSTARKGSLGRVLDEVRAGKVDVLVGTQMLAKGHDYPALTLVGVLGADNALFSADFRASERLHAQLVQVAGRAGRADRPGEVLIQTDFPYHPLYAAVARHDYDAFAAGALEERRAAGFPPYGFLAILRAESKREGEALAFLQAAARLARRRRSPVEVFDPVVAPLERKAGFVRAQLLVRAPTRPDMQPFLRAWREALVRQAERRVRWALDVDPLEV
jgi:primosomal protein N' (replication factor Y) (superfamily II helicase)